MEATPIPSGKKARSQDTSLLVRLSLGWGKIRRWYLCHLRPEYVKQSHARRRGHCNRTGACCKIMFTCPALQKMEDGNAKCGAYEWRPLNCSTFPIDERDLADRDLVMPDKPCGFFFVNDPSDPS